MDISETGVGRSEWRTDDPRLIEQRLLELAYTTDAPLSAATLAYYAPCSFDAAQRVLDDLVAHDRIGMEVDDAGAIHYTLPNRRRIAPPPSRAIGLREIYPPALRGGRDASPMLAAVLSLVVPGAGQLYTGNLGTAVLWFFVVVAGYTLIFPGVLLHIMCVAFAANAANRLNSSLARHHLLEHRT